MASNAQPPRRAPPSDAPLDPNERTSPSSTSVALGQPTAPAAAVRPDAPADLPLLGEDHLLPLPPALVSAGEEARLKQSQEEEESRKRRAQSEENEGENCIICLQEVRDRTVIVRDPRPCHPLPTLRLTRCEFVCKRSHAATITSASTASACGPTSLVRCVIPFHLLHSSSADDA